MSTICQICSDEPSTHCTIAAYLHRLWFEAIHKSMLKTIAVVPGLAGVQGKEKADALAGSAANMKDGSVDLGVL